MVLKNATGSFLLNTMKKIFDPNPVSVKATLNITTNPKGEILCTEIHTEKV